MGLLDKKVAVVTGAGSGIGRAVALGLAAEGASVVVGDYGVSVDGRDPSSAPAAAVVKEIEKAGGRALASAENVATMAGGKAMVDAALKSFGDLHVVVCCAGILRERMIFNMTEDEWDAVVAVHLKGAAGSFRQVDDNPALTLSFGKLSSGQRFHGLRKIHLNNSVQDPSFSTEDICGGMFHAAGVPGNLLDDQLKDVRKYPIIRKK